MERLTGSRHGYAWGSTSIIPELLGEEPGEHPLAELWFGAHANGPSPLASGASLGELIEDDPETVLGPSVVAAFGPRLPYLVKLIAPASPLSLQVHPSIDQAREGFAREERIGVPRDAAGRSYPDDNHKPEMVYALQTFEALAGFRTPRRAMELLSGLDSALAWDLFGDLRADPTAHGIEAAFTRLLDPATRPGAALVDETVAECARRLADGASPSVRSDTIVAQLAAAFPGDPGVIASLLMNPVTLRPGEALFTPAGGVHCYLSGLGVEVMASSDNVLRAGLSAKHVDIDGVLATVDWVAAPPVRIGPERVTEDVEVFYAPVDDFALAVATVEGGKLARLRGRGPRIVLGVEGVTQVSHAGAELDLRPGEAVFVPDSGEQIVVRGDGRIVQASVP